MTILVIGRRWIFDFIIFYFILMSVDYTHEDTEDILKVDKSWHVIRSLHKTSIYLNTIHRHVFNLLYGV